MDTQLLALSKIFTEWLFRIPDYQRGYACGGVGDVLSIFTFDGLIIMNHAFMGRAVYPCTGHFDEMIFIVYI